MKRVLGSLWRWFEHVFAQAQVIQWAEFLPSDLICQGDQTASSRGRLLLTQNNKYMRGQTLYVLKLQARPSRALFSLYLAS